MSGDHNDDDTIADTAVGRIERLFKSQSDDSSSQQVGPLLQQIGEGGMGNFWMAEREQPVRRRLARKLIKAEMADNRTRPDDIWGNDERSSDLAFSELCNVHHERPGSRHR